MFLTASELCKKEVVNILDGTCFGFADNVLVDTETRKIIAIIIYGKPKFFGIFSGEEDISIAWDKIERVGEDIILVKIENICKMHNEKESFLKKFLNFLFIK